LPHKALPRLNALIVRVKILRDREVTPLISENMVTV